MAKRQTTLKKKVSKRQTRKFSKKGGRKSMKKPASKQRKIKGGGMFGNKKELTTEEKQEKVNKEQSKLLKEDLQNINVKDTGIPTLGGRYIYKPILVTKMTGRDYIQAKFDIQPRDAAGQFMSTSPYLVLTMTGNDGTKTNITLHSQKMKNDVHKPRLWDMDLVKIKDFLIKEKEHIRIHSQHSHTYSGNIEKAIHNFILMIRNSNIEHGSPGLKRIRRFYRPGQEMRDEHDMPRNGYKNAELYLAELKKLDGRAKSNLPEEWKDYEVRETRKTYRGEGEVVAFPK